MLFRSPTAWWYILDERDATPHLDGQPTPVSFHGHTHRQGGWIKNALGIRRLLGGQKVLLEPECRYTFNPGSVGQPRDGDSRAAYLICDRLLGRIEFRRVKYDIALAIRAYRNAGREEMGQRLRAAH